jgi:hypothetical protein
MYIMVCAAISSSTELLPAGSISVAAAAAAPVMCLGHLNVGSQGPADDMHMHPWRLRFKRSLESDCMTIIVESVTGMRYSRTLTQIHDVLRMVYGLALYSTCATGTSVCIHA